MNLGELITSDLKPNGQGLQIVPIQVDEDYRKEWNIHEDDFYVVTKNGKLVHDKLFRLTRFTDENKMITEKYFTIFLQKESFYSKEVLKMAKSKKSKHLSNTCVIMNNNGDILAEQKAMLDYIYLVKDSCLYTEGDFIKNIETQEVICESKKMIESKEFVFAEQRYNFSYYPKKFELGVYQINKSDGSYTIHP